MKKILFVGLPGAGKGTQAQLLTKFGFVHLSTGDVIRAAFKNKDPLLLPYKKKIESGGLLPDKLIFDLVDKEIQKNKKSKGIILDGAVRTLPQAKFAIKEKLIDIVIFFTLSKKEATKRLMNRMQKSKIKRADDDPTVFKKRFTEYKKQTEPILDYLKQHTEFDEVDAAPSVEQIHKSVKKILEIN